MVELISSESICGNDQLAHITSYQGALSIQIYAMGFLEIAEVSLAAALEHQVAIDAITPSIIYAIRHAVELFLKYIVTEEYERAQVSSGEPKPGRKELQNELKGHNLLTLWGNCVERIRIIELLDYEAEHGEHCSFSRKEWLGDIQWIVGQLHKMDPSGTSLRYTVDTNGNPNINSSMVVSLAQLELFAKSVGKCFNDYVGRKC